MQITWKQCWAILCVVVATKIVEATLFSMKDKMKVCVAEMIFIDSNLYNGNYAY